MKVLGWTFGQCFDSFYEMASRRLGRPIKFEPLDSSVLSVDVAGASELLDAEHRVRIAESLGVEAAEAVAAHEVMHGVLIVEGYPKMAHHARANPEEERQLQSLSFQVMSVVVDPRIDTELQSLGFNTSKRHETQVRTHIGPTAVGNPRFAIPPRGSNEWMKLTCALLLLILESNDSTFTRLKAAYQKKAPSFWKEAVALANDLRKIGWATPEQAAAGIRFLRDELGLSGVLLVYDDANAGLT
jgi:hypothetical protein